MPFTCAATWSERSGWKALEGDGVLIEAALEGGRVSAPWSLIEELAGLVNILYSIAAT
jgi:hypothetical protein